jgi:hypothetical protein
MRFKLFAARRFSGGSCLNHFTGQKTPEHNSEHFNVSFMQDFEVML